MEWFSVDPQGLAALVLRRGRATVVNELIQNAWDTEATTVTVELARREGHAHLVVSDDDPHGFSNLAHAFTLFARSDKISDTSKRGRFNLGEKLVLALCIRAEIRSVNGAVIFDTDGRRDAPHLATKVGSVFEADIQFNDDDIDDVGQRIRRLLVPAGLAFYYNGQQVPPRVPTCTSRVQLPTEVADAEGILRPTRRITTIDLHDVAADETPTIYELGIPVVSWDGPVHVNVGMKVPLNFERDNVTPAYLRALRVVVLNELHARLTSDQLTGPWASAALEDPRLDKAAVRSVVNQRFGENAVAHDPSDPQAGKEAAAAGRQVVGGRALTKAAWRVIRDADPTLLPPAGQVTPSNAKLERRAGTAPSYQPTPAMSRILRYAETLAYQVLGITITARVVCEPNENYQAAYGSRTLTFNVGRLGQKWFEKPNPELVDALIVHELGHELFPVADHLDRRYYDSLCELAAKMRRCPTLLEAFEVPLAE